MMKKLNPARVDEFKKFALKGNVVDMAICVIIGGAFGKIVTSLVNDIIMPSISMLSGNSTKNLADLTFSLSDEKGAPVIKYGLFCQTVLDFHIIALTIFRAVRIICKLRARKEEPAAPAPPARDTISTPAPGETYRPRSGLTFTPTKGLLPSESGTPK